jgi:alpha-tubulin suppressor-like RCC1 family protein
VMRLTHIRHTRVRPIGPPMKFLALLLLAVVAVVACGPLGCSAGKGRESPGSSDAGSGGSMDGGAMASEAAASDDGAANDEMDNGLTGTLSLDLQIAPSLTISAVDWSLTNPALLPADRTGSVPVANSQAIQFVIGGLPAGDGYSITVTATTVGTQVLTCVGSAVFSVQANTTSAVGINLVCSGGGADAGGGSVSIGGTATIAPSCAAVTSLSASPSEVDLGGSIHLAANGIDAAGQSADVTFSWAVTGGTGMGTLTPATGASPAFVCTAAGPVTVTVTATIGSDAGTCQTNTSSVVLTCDAKKVIAIAVGPQAHACAVLSDSTVACWGYNSMGQLGNGKTVSSLTPVAVLNLTGVKAVATGEAHSCALLADTTVQCWGDMAALGTGAAAGLDDCGGRPCSMKPVPVAGITGATAIAAGATHSCALLSGGTIACWGDDVSGELGDGAMASQLTPVAVVGVSGATAISAGDSYSCALLAAGTVECWGYNLSGQLGSGAVGPDNCSGYPCSLKPVSVTGLSGVKAIACGGSHSCALLRDGTARCWGFNDVGELGNGTQVSSSAPVVVSNVTGAVSLTVGVYHACAVLSGGNVECWGDNSHGAFCNGSTTNSTTPIPISNLAGASAVAAGQYETCSLLRGGKVACCGFNSRGQLGDGTVSDAPTPMAVVF